MLTFKFVAQLLQAQAGTCMDRSQRFAGCIRDLLAGHAIVEGEFNHLALRVRERLQLCAQNCMGQRQGSVM